MNPISSNSPDAPQEQSTDQAAVTNETFDTSETPLETEPVSVTPGVVPET
jgi:hypothetical protein